jgi:heme-degrading monooxygenase HmoA
MIARTWRGRATKEKADDCVRHFETDVVQNLKGIPGNTGAYLLRRDADDGVEFLTLTFWDSIDAINRFWGGDSEVARIETEDRTALSAFDEFARNYEVVRNTLSARPSRTAKICLSKGTQP